METRIFSPAPVNNAPEFGTHADIDDFGAFLTDGRGNVNKIDSFDITPRFVKSLPYEITEPTEPTELTQDDVDLADDKEFLEQRYRHVHRFLGRGALARMVKGADRFLSLAATPIQSTKEDYDRRNQLLAEKYARTETDSRFGAAVKAIRRNKLRIATYGTPIVLGGFALKGAAPYIPDMAHNLSDWGSDISDSIGNAVDSLIPHRVVTMGDGEGFDMAANAIDHTPVRHEMGPTTVLAMGGHAQGSAEGSGYVASLETAGVIEAQDKVVPVDWSAQMGNVVTGPGAMNMDVSDQEGAARLMDAIRDQGNAPIKIVSFSQGTEATLRALNQEYGGKLPDNMEVVLIGTPSGRFGMSNNNIIGATNPVLKAMGFEIDQPIPEGNVTIRTHVNDVVGNSADQSAAFTGLMAVSPGHQVVEENNAVLLYTYQEGTTKYEVWGPPSGMNHPVSQLLEANGMPVSPELNNLFEAAVPRTPHGEATRYTDVGQTADALGVFLDSNTGGAPIASNVIDNVMTPELTHDVQTLTNLQMIPDQVAAGDIPGAINTAQDALGTFTEYVQNPNKLIDVANDGLQGTGIPFQLPPMEQMQAAAPVFSPAPAPAAPLQPLINQGMNFLQQVAPAIAPPPAPFQPGGYAPVGNLFSHSPTAGQYAPVGNLFG